jgi:glucose 1-dehydrogenase
MTASLATALPGFSLVGRRAVVTASSRGIGRAIATILGAAGASLVVHGTPEGGDLSQTVADVRATGASCMALVADFRDAAAVDAFALDAMAHLGGLDILVSNAAIQVRAAWDAMSSTDIDAQLQVNLKAMLQLVGRFAPGMLEQKWGRIVTIGSIQEARPHPQMVAYAASKAAQTSVVVNLARQFAADGVTVNNLAPGVIVTDRNTAALADPTYAAAVLDRIPAKAFGTAQDCAGAALLLCSDAGRYITGSSLYVDGGMHL